ncbi:MAG: transcription-repair coupling factor [Verrucomicrobiota bacterium]|nr:transcription-repair coupling factor [Verrucomicrobiota bacterium]
MGKRFFEIFSATPAAQRLRKRVEEELLVPVSGISEAAQSFLAAQLAHFFPERPLVVVTSGLKAQEAMHQDIETWQHLSDKKERPTLFYPGWEILPHESRLPHADVISERLETLVALSRKDANIPPVIVTTCTALMQRTFPKGYVEEHTRILLRGSRMEPLDLVEWLETEGYESEAQVTQKGELAMRGGIVDIYPLTSPWPVRLEFFGDELESIREFDPMTQISREEIVEVALPPAGELGILKRLKEGNTLGSFFDYLPPETVLLFCEPELLDTQSSGYELQFGGSADFFLTWSKVLEAATRIRRVELREKEVESDWEQSESILYELPDLEPWRPLNARAPEPHIIEAQRREFFNQLNRWKDENFRVHVICNNNGERERFCEVWRELGFGSAESAFDLHLGTIGRGFISLDAKSVVVTDSEIFGRYKIQRPRRLKSPHAAATRSALDIDFSDLNAGDYVVHLQHGIARYHGLEALPMAQKTDPSPAENTQECLVLEFAASDPGQPPPRLYVPVTEAHLVSKYVGTGKARPTLNTLGGARWAKTKEQAERAVRDLAAELLQVQAVRAAQSGHPFPPDTSWQREFESAFMYEETRDQLRAIEATKKDMETPKPMDRLICGDVGYGKTEVAIRAAFKSVMSGKQVAILVPTTVLAQQHYNTFRERMADYPVKVEQLSRFRTRPQQKKIIQQLAEGSVDIIVGTHRLIQEDIVFKDLGLVVIDEEQRFGVLHKEKLKLLRTMVDVLTLSATPIPRTLYLALTGARDMSTIETPPQDRLPVETIVTQYDERLIREAIQRELNRGGQVYFLHNRVLDIESVALRIRSLVPTARVIVGHGQMESDDLEDVMAAFINGEADVLVSTTIIESGIDIPNANTIIIDRADRFGLSDLYQLRGRVGRYKHQAYAYLLLPRHAALLSDVRKRISAIKQYSSLGSGFKIAMRDLEIRGAGNLLGSQQSGHITAVGFDLYCQLLKQSVASLKGEKVKRRVEVQVAIDFLTLQPGGAPETDTIFDDIPASRANAPSIPREVPTYVSETRSAPAEPVAKPLPPVPAYIPLEYISEPQHRIEFYRKLAQSSTKEEVAAIGKEFRDRFGKLPPSVEILLQLTEIKILAGERGVTKIETKADKLMMIRNSDYVMVGSKFPRLTKKDARGRLNEIRKLLLAIV